MVIVLMKINLNPKKNTKPSNQTPTNVRKMKRKRTRNSLSSSHQQSISKSTTRSKSISATYFYLHECWEFVFKFLINGDENNSCSYFKSLSFVSCSFSPSPTVLDFHSTYGVQHALSSLASSEGSSTSPPSTSDATSVASTSFSAKFLVSH